MSELQLFHMGFQIVIKSEKALQALKFLEALEISDEEIGKYQAFRKKEESEFQTQFARIIGELNLD